MKYGTRQQLFIRQPTGAVLTLLIINCCVFMFQVLLRPPASIQFARAFGLRIEGITSGLLWQPVTYMFLHAGFLHLLGNMLILYFLGLEVESILGPRRFLRLYILWGVLAGAGWILLTAVFKPLAVCVGASGAVFGVIGMYAALFPDRIITLYLFFILPITLRARTLAIGLGLMALVGMINSNGNVAHSAHLFGGLAGYFFGIRLLKNPFRTSSTSPQWDNPFFRWLSSLKARFSKPKLRVINRDDPHSDNDEIDAILDKINRTGIQSLTNREWEILRKAGKNS